MLRSSFLTLCAAAMLAIAWASNTAASDSELLASHSGTINYLLTENEFGTLMNHLQNLETLPKVPQDLFRTLNNKQLVDIVAYFDDRGIAHARVCKADQARAKLYGEQTIYLLLFRATYANPPDSAKGQTTDSVRSGTVFTKGLKGNEKYVEEADSYSFKPKVPGVDISFSQLQVFGGSGEATVGKVLAAISSAVGLAAPSGEAPKAPRDTSLTLKFRDIVCNSCEKTQPQLQYAYTKLRLEQNAIHGLRIQADKNRDIYTRFGNYDASRIAVSIGAALSSRQKISPDPGDTAKSIYEFRTFGVHSMEIQPFVFLHIYPFARPERPPLSKTLVPKLSFVIGTVIDFNNFAREVTLGAALGDIDLIAGRFYLIGGRNFSKFTGLKQGDRYDDEWMIAVSYRL